VIGADGGMYIKVFSDGMWHEWAALGKPAVGLQTSRPAAISGLGFMDVYAIGGDNLLWHRQWSGNHWNEWARADARPTAAANGLTAAIYNRLMTTTIDPLVRAGAAALAGPLGVLGYAALGSNQHWIVWSAASAQQCWEWSTGEHMTRIIDMLRQGKPVIVGLVNPHDIVGHQVVVWGADIRASGPQGEDALPGEYDYLYIYDNELPGCDSAALQYDPINRRITQLPGGWDWKGVFARDDYKPAPPPVL